MSSSDDDEDAAVPSRSGPVPLVWQQLQGLGFQRVAGNYGASHGACAASALSTGFLLFPANASALDAPARRYDGKPLEAFGGEFTENECPHRWAPTLRQLLSQPDYAGTDYESGLSKATVLCPEALCEERIVWHPLRALLRRQSGGLGLGLPRGHLLQRLRVRRGGIEGSGGRRAHGQHLRRQRHCCCCCCCCCWCPGALAGW
jgi:hypothetical protein